MRPFMVNGPTSALIQADRSRVDGTAQKVDPIEPEALLREGFNLLHKRVADAPALKRRVYGHFGELPLPRFILFERDNAYGLTPDKRRKHAIVSLHILFWMIVHPLIGSFDRMQLRNPGNVQFGEGLEVSHVVSAELHERKLSTKRLFDVATLDAREARVLVPLMKEPSRLIVPWASQGTS